MTDQAIEWVLRQAQSPADLQMQREFAAWCAQEASHLTAYQEARALWDSAVLAEASRHIAQYNNPRRFRYVAMAASIAAAMFIGTLVPDAFGYRRIGVMLERVGMVMMWRRASFRTMAG